MLGLGLLGVVVGATVVVAVLGTRGTSEITGADAVQSFRSSGHGPAVSTAEPGVTAPHLPAVGVYTYAATGEEIVQLGPLPAETRPLPQTVTAVVRHESGAANCFVWELNLFVEHTESTRYCVQNEGLRIDEHIKHQKIGVLSPTASMQCAPDSLPTTGGAAEAGGTARLTCRLDLSGGPASIVADLVGTATPGPPDDVAVGDVEVSATPVTVGLEVTGDLSGSWTETTWWSDDHTPVRIHRDLELVGLASFTERSRLELTRMEPAV